MASTVIEGTRPRCDLGLAPGSRAWYEEHRFATARLLALLRDEWRCVDCAAEDWTTDLEVHHLAPVRDYRDGCAHHVDGLVTLCVSCHRWRHRLLRAEDGEQLALHLRELVSA